MTNRLDSDITPGLMWVKTVCKGYQQMQEIVTSRQSLSILYRKIKSSHVLFFLIKQHIYFGSNKGSIYDIAEKVPFLLINDS